MAKRITLPPDELKELKSKVRARDGERCRKCKAPAWHCHHIQFRSDQGSDTSQNLACLCDRCHLAVHGRIKDYFLVIVNPQSDLIPPDANVALKFKTYNTIRKRVRWRI